ncbi:DUF58 domain-containing protein [Bifidobacterium aemilianum]|uniref:DUF58 domain-containing protein n=1 Tax=Bifidobacterium aemilianum TaxID=2493120 RepID=A0A366KAZ1_9BIFI|nr:DUF58 domain-containing protein [Bifidobacterium aemilianum]RBP98412.1 DUF58 domain-containing protein [Bifidobacterium aemilianum]
MIDPLIETPPDKAAVRRRIEVLSTSLSLPIVRKALGMLEGEHSSHHSLGSDEVMDTRLYEPGDEARTIDWNTSARVGRPMVTLRERLVTSKVWLLLDAGLEMSGSCDSGERAYELACNALCMFAALSLKRGDDISLVFGDSAAIRRVPFHGGFAQFEGTLDASTQDLWLRPRNIEALLSYARTIRDRHSLIVLATDEHALEEVHLKQISAIAQTHPLVLVDVATINPLSMSGYARIFDGNSPRRIPAFMRSDKAAQEVETHRSYLAAALERELRRCGSTMIHPKTSEDMFAQFVRLISSSLAQSTGGQGWPANMPKARSVI